MNFVGQTRALDSAALEAVSSALHVPAAGIWAVLHVEAAGCGFLPDRRPIIRFERHIFHRLTAGQYDRTHPEISNSVPGNAAPEGAAQYTLLEKALSLNPEAALKSASWGLFQILGANHGLAGFSDAESLLAAMIESEGAQLDAFRSFLQSAHLAAYLQTQNWAAFARGYNGADFERHQYAQQLAAAYKLFSSGSMPDLDVRAAQLYLTLRGFAPDGIDGVLGPRTTAAIGSFQASAGLPQSGKLDADTMSALLPK
jgi:N-acetylmuramidase/Putative peptidoglycan binding domain